MSQPLRSLLPPAWGELLDETTARALDDVEAFLVAERAVGLDFQPRPDRVFRALALTSPKDVSVVILGQDPYPTPGVPTGLAFDVGPDAPLPQSLKNIFSEYEADLGLPRPNSGDLSPWAERGVLLLNSFLTCRPGEAGSHRKAGWDRVTGGLLAAMTEVNPDVVFVCWGQPALRTVQKLPPTGRLIASAHPSPLSARRGFFGSRPFSRANAALAELERNPVDWRLP